MNRLAVAAILLAAPALILVGQRHTTGSTAGNVCYVYDGDTVRMCDGTRVRLNGIDAPEMPGHCRPGRDCAPGDPYGSREALKHLVDGQRVRVETYKTDRYGRSVSDLYLGTGQNVSCLQLSLGFARYVPRWDEHGAVRGVCPGESQK